MIKKSLACFALAGLGLCAAPVYATDVVVDQFAHGSELVYSWLFAPNPQQFDAYEAGGVLTSVAGLGSFSAYCVELTQALTQQSTYTDYSVVSGGAYSFMNPSAHQDIARLFSAGHVLDNSVSEAAFQIAIWEMAYETEGHYSLLTGASQFLGGTAETSGALALASNWLTSLPAANLGYQINVLQSPTGQDLLVASMVPEPGTYGLMAAGLLAMGFLSRRRPQRQR